MTAPRHRGRVAGGRAARLECPEAELASGSAARCARERRCESPSSSSYRGGRWAAAAIRFVEVSQPSYYKIITPDYNHAAGRSI